MNSYKTIQVNKKQVRYHRYLMEKHLNRKLNFNELVHHINGNIFDNRIENLELVTRSEHMKEHPEILRKSLEKITLKLDIIKIKELYKTMSIQKVAKYFNVSAMSIWLRLKKANVKTNNRGYKFK